MTRYQVSVEGDSIAELIDHLHHLAAALDAPGVHNGAARPSPISTGAPLCPNGHGPMTLIHGGVAQAGPRKGQPYNPFWRCTQKCGAKSELAPSDATLTEADLFRGHGFAQ